MHRSHSLITVAKATACAESVHSSDSYLILEKYNRLLESHHKLLRVNQNLEDKLLKVVTICEEQKAVMKAELEDLRERTAAAESRAERLEEENIKYRRDCLLAVQLLRCNPNGFVDHELSSLPAHVRSKLSPSTKAFSNGFGDHDTDSDDSSHRPSANVPEFEIFPIVFPPSAIMVPSIRRDRSSPNPFATLHNDPDHRSEFTVGSRRISAETIANVISEDLRSRSPMNGDIRARQTAASRGDLGDGPSRIQHV